MPEREEFITFLNELKAVSPMITPGQRVRVLQRAVQQYGFMPDEASDLLEKVGLLVGEEVNYFEILGFSVEDFEYMDESGIVNRVEAAYKERYSESLRAGGRVRPDGKTEEQWRVLLNQARDILKSREKRQEHITLLRTEVSSHTEPMSVVGFLGSEGITSEASIPEDMVLIPSGEFPMGSDDAETYAHEQPVHTVYVDAFYMDVHEVTNAEYQSFVLANPEWQKGRISSSYARNTYLSDWRKNSYPASMADYPVVYVSWYAAMAYAEWVGKRLPTEAEWERAARGGEVGLKYPWGDKITSRDANYDNNLGGRSAVGSYAPNGYGLYDMVGNVWEWCLDAYKSDFYTHSPDRNPLAGVGTVMDVTALITDFRRVISHRVVRGGGWWSPPGHLRAANRTGHSPTTAYGGNSFRCVRSVLS